MITVVTPYGKSIEFKDGKTVERIGDFDTYVIWDGPAGAGSKKLGQFPKNWGFFWNKSGEIK